MDVKIEWSEEKVGYGVLSVSGQKKTIVYLINNETEWGWAVDDNAVLGFANKKAAQLNALEYFVNEQADYYEKVYGIRK